MNAMVECPVCGHGATFEFLRRSAVPVHQNLPLPDAQSAREAAKGELGLRACTHCSFVYNGLFDPALVNYGSEYDNTQTHSLVFSSHVDELIAELATRHEGHGRVVEIGCGKGGFLRRLVARLGEGYVGYGFDPTYQGPDDLPEERVHFRRTFYDEHASELSADLVVCRHVIEHVADPVALLTAVRRALGDSKEARVCFETPDVSWILRNQIIWDFFYEHCSLFTADALATAFQRAGFDVTSTRRVFGGQYLWLEAIPGSMETPAFVASEEVLEQAKDYGRYEKAWVSQYQARLREVAASGRVAVWRAGAKGVTFCNLTDPDGLLIDCVIDINPTKQGRFIVGTGHPIVAPDRLLGRGITVVLVLNPNYLHEISYNPHLCDSAITVLDLMNTNEVI